jgi:hypothetical protein
VKNKPVNEGDIPEVGDDTGGEMEKRELVGEVDAHI